MKRFLQFVFLFLFISLSALAQKEHNIWYFGTFAGIDFNSGSPMFLTGGQTNVYEGVAGICDNNGNMLFYTDGINVWDKTNTQMPNGNGLLGQNSSTEAAIIVKMPGSGSLYYIFTTPEVNHANTTPASYSIVDMSLNGGLGDVTTKNVTVLLPSTEKVTYARNANGTDYWIIYHKWNSADYYSYQLTSTGFNATPVISTSGQLFGNGSNFNDIGYLKASPCGNKLAMGSMGYNTLELFDFNNSTGVVSNGYTLQNSTQVYGTEFSPGGNFLYCSTNYGSSIYQFNLKAGSLPAISASKKLVGTSSGYCNGMQTGPDGKIYIVNQGGNFLSAINNPDVAGTACNFVDSAVACIGGVFGLPNYVAEQFCNNNPPKPVALFNTADTLICKGQCIRFSNQSTNATTYKWSFPGGNVSSSTDSVPTVCYNVPGQYNVQLIAGNGSASDTLLLSKYITVKEGPNAGTVTSSHDSICEGLGIKSVLNIMGSTGNIQWQSSTTGGSFTDIPSADSTTYTTPVNLQQTTQYRVMATNSCGTDSSNVVTVHILPFPIAFYTDTVNSKQVTFNSTGSSSDVTKYSWDFGDGVKSNDVNPTHLYTSAAVFYVCLTVNNGSSCTATYCQYIDLQDNGIVNLQSPVFVCPNPVAGKQLILVITDAITLTDAKVYVTDVLGRSRINTIPTGLQTLINVGDLAAGTYFLSVLSGKNLVVKKFVKQ